MSKAFSLKDATCATILESTPIILIDQLNAEAAGAMFLALDGLRQAGAVMELRCTEIGDLPKIEWPKAPLVFKQSIDSYVEMTKHTGPCPHCGQPVRVLDLTHRHLEGGGGDTDLYQPQEIEVRKPETSANEAPTPSSSGRRQPPTKAGAKQFTGQPMPEITPFSNPVLPSQESSSTETGHEGDVGTRIDELFPEDDAIIPDTSDITNILDRLLPDEHRSEMNTGSSSFQAVAHANGGYSVFLSKITDETRRQEAVPLLAELAGISSDDAEKLSKKVIIPVLRGVTQEEAEAAKQRFAHIKVLARVKAG
ncbi:MAG: hypothetical protein ACOCXA_08905 [Planctomycetota bacterium]